MEGANLLLREDIVFRSRDTAVCHGNANQDIVRRHSWGRKREERERLR
jgi:hypothetical protein